LDHGRKRDFAALTAPAFVPKLKLDRDSTASQRFDVTN